MIKIARCGAKEAVTAAFEVVVPEAVRHEATMEAFADGVLIAVNVAAGRVRVRQAPADPPEARVLPPGGERSVYALAAQRPAARIVSDDRRFIRRLAMLGQTAQTPATLLVALAARHVAPRPVILGWLELLRPLVSRIEYDAARVALKEVR